MKRNYVPGKPEIFTNEHINKAAIPVCRLMGVYFLCDDEGVKYVGQSNNIIGRLVNHEKMHEMRGQIRVSFIQCDLKDLNDVEMYFIDLLKPKLNYAIGGGSNRGSHIGLKKVEKDKVINTVKELYL